MRKLTREQFLKMDGWMRKNARAYDLAKWDFLFHGGSRDAIVTEMCRYQNPDGGKGLIQMDMVAGDHAGCAGMADQVALIIVRGGRRVIVVRETDNNILLQSGRCPYRIIIFIACSF